MSTSTKGFGRKTGGRSSAVGQLRLRVEDENPTGRTSKIRNTWSSYWSAPVLMITFFVAGLSFGSGHHVFYQSLDNTVVSSPEQQQWVIRIGTGLTFLAKASFAAAVGIAFMQYIWIVVKKKPMEIDSLDALFSLTTSVQSFMNFRLLSHVKTSVLLAIIFWLLPLMAAITPSTLSVKSRIDQNATTGLVPCPRFSIDSAEKLRAWSDQVGVNMISNPSPAVARLLTATASSIKILSIDAPFPNASYSYQFTGPSLKCDPLSVAIESKEPVGSCPNCSSLSEAWQSSFDIDITSVWYTAIAAIAPDGLDNFIFIKTGGDLTRGPTRKDISCQMWNTSYSVQLEYLNGVQSTILRSLDLIAPVTTTSRNPVDELPSSSKPFVSMFMAMANLLSGIVATPNGLSPSALRGGDLAIINTGIMACLEILQIWRNTGPLSAPPMDQVTSPWMCRNQSVEKAVEDLFRNFTMSIVSSEVLSEKRTSEITVRYPQNYWHYSARELLLTYSVGTLAALTSILLGTWAFYVNGYSASTSFLTILATTRNIALDEIAQPNSMGSQPLSSSARKTQLQCEVPEAGQGSKYPEFRVKEATISSDSA